LFVTAIAIVGWALDPVGIAALDKAGIATRAHMSATSISSRALILRFACSIELVISKLLSIISDTLSQVFQQLHPRQGDTLAREQLSRLYTRKK
jgi:hypothetical protein